MKQERLLKLAKKGIVQQLNTEKEIKERFEARTGQKSKIQEVRINKLWKEYDEIVEMLRELDN
ncbi:hypothetical protein [uncultured Thomasclavelia sp.]|uniref:hypothetical protein n=1 Tax=uncultured Thomasclavelia sp. TaxID=3025759 RepID=UPI002626512A|nr:hypothetical protein [uncultured Thomasclavelia sp.]